MTAEGKRGRWAPSHTVSLVALSVLISHPPDAGARALAPCPPSVEVHAAPELASALAAALVRHGVTTQLRPACPFVSAGVERDQDGLRVAIRDPEGRAAVRPARDVEAAATLIETWARPDLSDALLEGPPDERPSRLLAPVTPAPEPETLSPTGIAAGAEASVAGDGSLWIGARGAACAALGPICAGVVGRVSLDNATAGGSLRGATSRVAADVLAAAETTFAFGPGFLRPGVGLGFGWMRSTSLHAQDDSGDPIDLDTSGLRAELSLGFQAPLFAGLGIDGTASASFSPFARTDHLDAVGAVLPGEPAVFFRLDLGLRYGGVR